MRSARDEVEELLSSAGYTLFGAGVLALGRLATLARTSRLTELRRLLPPIAAVIDAIAEGDRPTPP